MLTKLERRVCEHYENFNKEMGNIRQYQIEVRELKHIIEMKNTLEGFNIRLDEAEEKTSTFE